VSHCRIFGKDTFSTDSNGFSTDSNESFKRDEGNAGQDVLSGLTSYRYCTITLHRIINCCARETRRPNNTIEAVVTDSLF
jgi:hypothetical protein